MRGDGSRTISVFGIGILKVVHSWVQAKSEIQSTGLPRFTRPHNSSIQGTIVVNVGEASRFLPVSKLNTVYEAVAAHEAAYMSKQLK
jgi:hypothetical protein